MAIETWDYYQNFNGQANESPWVDPDWTDIHGTMQINTNGLRMNGNISASARHSAAFLDTYRVGITIVSSIGTYGDAVGPALFVASGANAGKGYFLWCDGALGSIRRRDLSSGNGGNLAPSTFPITSPVNGDEFWLEYNPVNGLLTAYHNGVSIATRTDTTFQSESFCGGVIGSATNGNARRIGAIGIEGISLASVTIDSTPSDVRVTESRTIRITVLSTAPTPANTSLKIDSASNAAITPVSCTLASGMTYDVVFAVPDTYAGLKYSSSGYKIIVTTTDGSVTSPDVPYLPVSGNSYVNPSSVPGDFDVSLGGLAVGDQIEYETNGGEISVGLDCVITSSVPVSSFDARAWDETDSTWGSWASQTLNEEVVVEIPPVTGVAVRSRDLQIINNLSIATKLTNLGGILQSLLDRTADLDERVSDLE